MMVPSQKEDGQDALLMTYLLQAKDDSIRATEKELHRTIEGKDEVIRATEKELHRTIEGKDEVIRAKDDLVRAKDDLLREVRSKLAETTAMLWHIEGKLNLRNTIEKFEATSIGGRKDTGDGASGSVDVAGITKGMSECSTER
jgi:hypothetical protein